MRKHLAGLSAVLLLCAMGMVSADAEPIDMPTQTEPSHDMGNANDKLSVQSLNDLVNSANFLVDVGGYGLCSGTLISVQYRLILTAHHCIDWAIKQVEKEVNEDGEIVKKKVEVLDDVTVEQTYYSGARAVGTSTYKATIVGYDADQDLGLLQIRADSIPNKEAVHVFGSEHGTVERGDEVWAFGNPLGLENSLSFGHLASTTRLFKRSNGTEVVFLQTDAGMLTFGNSGGALMKGKYLIGVPDLTVPGTPVSLSVPYGTVQELLTKYGYEDVWNDHPKQTHAEWEAEKKAKEDDKDVSVKDLLRKLVDKKAEPTSSSDGYLWENGHPAYYLRATSLEDYNAAMDKVAGCTLATYPACMETPEPAVEDTGFAPKKSVWQTVIDSIFN